MKYFLSLLFIFNLNAFAGDTSPPALQTSLDQIQSFPNKPKPTKDVEKQINQHLRKVREAKFDLKKLKDELDVAEKMKKPAHEKDECSGCTSLIETYCNRPKCEAAIQSWINSSTITFGMFSQQTPIEKEMEEKNFMEGCTIEPDAPENCMNLYTSPQCSQAITSDIIITWSEFKGKWSGGMGMGQPLKLSEDSQKKWDEWTRRTNELDTTLNRCWIVRKINLLQDLSNKVWMKIATIDDENYQLSRIANEYDTSAKEKQINESFQPKHFPAQTGFNGGPPISAELEKIRQSYGQGLKGVGMGGF